MQYSMSLDGLPELQKKLGKSGYVTAVKSGMQKAVVYLEGAIKKQTPVKTGQLRASFTHQVAADGMEGVIGSSKAYAPMVESGTGVYAGKGRIYPISKKALAWNGMVRKSVAGMRGRFFVKKAWEEEGGGKLLRFFTDEIDGVLKSE